MSAALEITLVAGAALALAWLWRPRRPIEPGIRLLLIAYAALGIWALFFGAFAAPGREPAAFALWKPTVMYGVLSAILLLAPAMGWGYPVKAIVGAYFVFSNREWHWINLGFAAACALLGGLNLFIIAEHTQDDWEGFKWSCMVNVLAVLLLRLTFVWVDTVVRLAIAVHGRIRALLR
jgi:intracellular septation protein A